MQLTSPSSSPALSNISRIVCGYQQLSLWRSEGWADLLFGVESTTEEAPIFILITSILVFVT